MTIKTHWKGLKLFLHHSGSRKYSVSKNGQVLSTLFAAFIYYWWFFCQGSINLCSLIKAPHQYTGENWGIDDLLRPLTFCDSVWKQFLTNHFGLFLFCFLPFQCPKTPPNFDVNLAKILETHEQEIADRRASAITLEHLVHELNEERRAKNDEILRLKVLWIKLYHQFLRLQ